MEMTGEEIFNFIEESLKNQEDMDTKQREWGCKPQKEFPKNSWENTRCTKWTKRKVMVRMRKMRGNTQPKINKYGMDKWPPSSIHPMER